MKKFFLAAIVILFLLSCTDNGARDQAHYFTPEGPMAGDSTQTDSTQIQSDEKTNQ